MPGIQVTKFKIASQSFIDQMDKLISHINETSSKLKTYDFTSSEGKYSVFWGPIDLVKRSEHFEKHCYYAHNDDTKLAGIIIPFTL